MAARAPKMCGHIDPDGTMCRELVRGVRYCEEHRPAHTWQRVDTKRSGTSAHQTRRLRVLRRDGYRCQIGYTGICLGTANELDHIIPIGEGGADTDENGQAACRACQLAKATREAHRASGHRVVEPARNVKQPPSHAQELPRVIITGG
ncbi:MAG: HNH endonuclease [Mycobacterium sp.]|nr:HNH endonuclease [Mycobacterium sp.]